MVINEDYAETLHEVIDDYNYMTFWHELKVRLGKRDFQHTMTDEEEKEMEKNGGWYPSRIADLYKKWNAEFEEYGVERLEVKASGK